MTRWLSTPTIFHNEYARQYTSALPVNHDDVIKTKHFPRYWPFVREFTGHRWIERPVTRSFDVFFDLPLNKRLNKQSWGWWFETLSCSLWRHSNDVYNVNVQETSVTEHAIVETDYLIEAVWRICASINYPSLVQIMACRLAGAKPLYEPMLEYF